MSIFCRIGEFSITFTHIFDQSKITNLWLKSANGWILFSRSVHIVFSTLSLFKLLNQYVKNEDSYRYFYSDEGIRIHIKMAHENEKWKHCCNKCDSRFSNTTGLISHLQVLHKIPDPTKLFKIRKTENGTFVLVDK